jgi:hypothetical protein
MKTFISISIFLFLGIGCANAQVSLRVTQPTNNSHVQHKNNTIIISAPQGIPVGQCIVVFVQDPKGNWWPYIDVNPTNSNKTLWQVEEVQFGVVADINRTFSIQAILINNSLKANGFGIQINSDGGSYSTANYNLINHNHSAIVSVIRY